MTAKELIAHLRSLCDACGSQKATAEALGVSPAYLSDVLSGRREPGQKILDGIGVERVVTYEWKKGVI